MKIVTTLLMFSCFGCAIAASINRTTEDPWIPITTPASSINADSKVKLCCLTVQWYAVTYSFCQESKPSSESKSSGDNQIGTTYTIYQLQHALDRIRQILDNPDQRKRRKRQCGNGCCNCNSGGGGGGGGGGNFGDAPASAYGYSNPYRGPLYPQNTP